jgi:hypothetical protein
VEIDRPFRGKHGAASQKTSHLHTRCRENLKLAKFKDVSLHQYSRDFVQKMELSKTTFVCYFDAVVELLEALAFYWNNFY